MSYQVTDESAIRGLMLLGRTREEATKEFREAELRREMKYEKIFWNSGLEYNSNDPCKN